MEYQYITTRALLKLSKIKYTIRDYHAIGERIHLRYLAAHGKHPAKILSINSNKGSLKACSLYPVEFIDVMQDVVIDHFSG